MQMLTVGECQSSIILLKDKEIMKKVSSGTEWLFYSGFIDITMTS